MQLHDAKTLIQLAKEGVTLVSASKKSLVDPDNFTIPLCIFGIIAGACYRGSNFVGKVEFQISDLTLCLFDKSDRDTQIYIPIKWVKKFGLEGIVNGGYAKQVDTVTFNLNYLKEPPNFSSEEKLFLELEKGLHPMAVERLKQTLSIYLDYPLCIKIFNRFEELQKNSRNSQNSTPQLSRTDILIEEPDVQVVPAESFLESDFDLEERDKKGGMSAREIEEALGVFRHELPKPKSKRKTSKKTKS